MTVAQGQCLAALVAFFVDSGYRLPSSIRCPEGTYRYTNYGSNSEELYAQEQQTGFNVRAVITQPRFSLNYGSESQVLEVHLSGNQVQKVIDKINRREYFPSVSGSQAIIDGTTYQKG